MASFFVVPKAYAASLASTSATLTTSRPSASAPITANIAANATQVNVTDSFTSPTIWLASDSATFRPDTSETLRTVTIASASASSGGARTIYFVAGPTSTFHAGDALTVPITSLHTIRFTTVNPIPASGKIVINYPALTGNDATAQASPSASTFQFNALASANITATGVTCSTYTISAPNITCNVNASGVAANTLVTLNIGCSAANGAGSCTTGVPTLINPTKSNTTAGSADTWTVNVSTQDSSGNGVDTSRIRIATVEAVQVQATVDPTLTVTIAGLANGANFQSSSTACASETSNAGLDATASFVNLGILASGTINKSGQTITVSTNAANGYTITATSSGRFINPATGVWLTDANGGNGLTNYDTPLPAVFPSSGNAAFGISPCGSRVNPTIWGTTAAFAFGSGAKASNPWNTGVNSYYSTIASYTGGPVSADVTVIRYAATISGVTPAGIYGNYFTYVVTPSF